MTEQPATLSQLKERLAELEQAHELCNYIDHYPDVVRCREQFRPLIDRVKAEIGRREREGHHDAA
jgi:hypothetical protein